MDTLNVAIIGHVDHGKSTLIGRLLYELGALPAEKMAQINLSNNETGKFDFAHIMDSFEEERLLGMTMDTSNIVFRNGGRQYTIIDVPGHLEFLSKMATGASYADAAILIIDVVEGVQKQTILHDHLLSMMNVDQIIILINKMDLVSYGQTDFDKTRANELALLKSMNMESCQVIPVSAGLGDNVTTKSSNMPWYSGMTVLAALDSFVTTKQAAQALCFPVQDIYKFNGERIVVGQIESGKMILDQRLLMLQNQTYYNLREIKKFGKSNIQQAKQGECVGIILEGENLSAIKRGVVFSDSESLSVSPKVTGRVFWLVDEPCVVGNCYSICCATQSVKGTVVKITNHLHVPAGNELVYSVSADSLGLGEISDIEIELEKPLVFQTGKGKALSNFVMKKEGVSTGGGTF